MKFLLTITEHKNSYRFAEVVDRFIVESDASGEISIVREGRPLVERDRSVDIGLKQRLNVEAIA